MTGRRRMRGALLLAGAALGTGGAARSQLLPSLPITGLPVPLPHAVGGLPVVGDLVRSLSAEERRQVFGNRKTHFRRLFERATTLLEGLEQPTIAMQTRRKTSMAASLGSSISRRTRGERESYPPL